MKRSRESVPLPLPFLPLEIWGVIFSFVPFYHLLRSCTTVCREWYLDDFLFNCVQSMNPRELARVDDKILRKMRNVTRLSIFDQFMKHTITNYGLETLAHLKSFSLISSKAIDNNALKKMTSLTELAFSALTKITDDGIKDLTNLRTLRLSAANAITIEGIKNLTNLVSLHTGKNKWFDDQCIATLTCLRSLSLTHNEKITGQCLSALTALEDLCVAEQGSRFDGHNLRYVAHSLTSLDLSRLEGVVEDAHLRYLTRLRKLKLNGNETITDTGLSYLSSLTKLKLGHNTKITNAGVESLTSLRKLFLIQTSASTVNPRTLSTKHGLVVEGTEQSTSPLLMLIFTGQI